MTAALPRLHDRDGPFKIYLGPRRVAATNLRASDSDQRCVSCPDSATITFDLQSGLIGHLCDACLENYLASPIARVYFVRAGDMVKIGHSVDVDARLKMHQTGSPVPLELWHTELGGRTEEAELHRRFAADRAHGEWFHLSDAIRAYVEGTA